MMMYVGKKLSTVRFVAWASLFKVSPKHVFFDTGELKVLHEAKMVSIEKHKESERQERQQVFSDQFSEDIKNFKEHGEITRKFSEGRAFVSNLLCVELSFFLFFFHACFIVFVIVIVQSITIYG